jgi:hypothetical protein
MSTPHAATLQKAKNAIIDAWLAGLSGTNSDILRQPSAEHLSQPSLDAARRYWAERGEAAKAIDPAQGKRVWAVYGWGVPEGATLADALRAAAGTYPGSLPPVRTGTRYALDLPDYCGDEQLMAGANRVTAGQLQTLPDRAFEVALTRGRGRRQSGHNLRWQMRRFLRWAIASGQLPIHFAARVTRTPWDDVADEVWPSPRQRTTAATYRAAWHRAATIAHELYGRNVQPSDLSSERIEAISSQILASGHPRLAETVRSAISAAGKAGHLPQWTPPQRRRTGMRLPVPDGISIDQDPWGALRAALLGAGFAEDFSAFFDWFQQFRTLDSKEMRRRRAEFPRRPPHKHLRPGSQIQYVRSILRWLSSATRELGPAEALTPMQVFGTGFPQVLARFEEEVEGEARLGRCSAHGSGARNVIICASAIAADLYTHLRHLEGHSFSLSASRSGERLDLKSEQRKELAPELRSLLDAHHEGFTAIAEMSAAATDANATGKGRNSTRHVERTVQRYSFDRYWVPLLDAALNVLQQEAKRKPTLSFHLAVRNAFLLALSVSTAARPREMCIAVIGDHYRPWSDSPEDILHLPAGLRKNAVAHDAPIIRRFVPKWLEDLYKVSRASLLARNPHPTGSDLGALFLCRTGRALAAPGMSEADIKSGINTLRVAFRNFVATTARVAGLTPPTEAGYRGFYVIRGAAGDLVNTRLGPYEAAKLLGNHPNTAAISYASRTGRDVRHDELLAPTETAPLSAGDRSLAEEIAGYKQLLDDGTIDPETFGVMVRQLRLSHAG